MIVLKDIFALMAAVSLNVALTKIVPLVRNVSVDIVFSYVVVIANARVMKFVIVTDVKLVVAIMDNVPNI